MIDSSSPFQFETWMSLAGISRGPGTRQATLGVKNRPWVRNLLAVCFNSVLIVTVGNVYASFEVCGTCFK
jgi:hypothetical protein